MRYILTAALWAASTAAQADQIAVIFNTSDELAVFDTATETFTTIGPLGFDFRFGALAYDPVRNKLYATELITQQVFDVDLTTGAATPLFTLPIQPIAAAWDPGFNALIVGEITGSGWYYVDPTSGLTAPLFNFGIIPSGAGWSPRENAIVYNQIAAATFYAYDAVNQQNILLGGPGTFINDTGLSYDASRDLYWSFDYSGVIRTFDPNSLYAESVITTTGPAIDASETISFGPPPPRFSVSRTSGTCPGNESFTAVHGTPAGRISFVGGNTGGTFTIPTGVCAGTSVPLGAPRLLSQVTADAAGSATYSVRIPAAGCSKALVAVDMTTCRVSNVTTP